MRSFSKLFGQSQAPTAAATNQPAKLTLEAFFGNPPEKWLC